MSTRTLNRLCDGCVHGATPDDGFMERADEVLASLRPGDTHACHRTDGTVSAPVCRGFIERHPAAASLRESRDTWIEDDADAVDLAFYRRTRAHVSKEVVRLVEESLRSLAVRGEVRLRVIGEGEVEERVIRREDYGL